MKTIKKLCAYSLIVAFLICMVPVTVRSAQAAAATGITSGAYYFIKNAYSGLTLDIDMYNKYTYQQHKHGGNNQQFQLVYNSSTGYYRIIPRSLPDHSLDVWDGSNTNGSSITAYWTHTGTNQDWNIIRNSNGTYRLLTRCSSSTKALVVAGASTSPGASVYQWQYNNSNNDNWYLEPVGGTTADRDSYASLYASDKELDVWAGGAASPQEDVRQFAELARLTFGFDELLYSHTAQRSDLIGKANGKQATMLYWTAHGASGNMSYYSGSNYMSYSPGFNGPSQIGNSMLSANSSQGYYSNSQWNNGLKWAILASCNQLTDPYHKNWVRTLLGTPKRARSIWGYAQTAPDGPIDTNILLYFSYYCQLGYSIMDAWACANADYGRYQWAGLMHDANKHDKIPKFGAVSADTTIYSYPNIRYIKGGYESGISYTASLPNPVAEAYIFDYESRNSGGLQNQSNTVIEGVAESSAISIASPTSIIDIRLPEFDKTSVIKSLKASKFDVMALDDRIRITHHSMNVDKPISFSANEAERKVKDYVISNEILKQDMLDQMDYKVYPITDQYIDAVDFKNNGTPNTVAYMVVFRRNINGIPFAPEFGNSVKAIVDNNGVCWSSTNWENVSIKEKVILMSDTSINASLSPAISGNIINKELMYIPSDIQNSKSNIIPVWKIETPEKTFWVDAITGDSINNTTDKKDNTPPETRIEGSIVVPGQVIPQPTPIPTTPSLSDMPTASPKPSNHQ